MVLKPRREKFIQKSPHYKFLALLLKLGPQNFTNCNGQLENIALATLDLLLFSNKIMLANGSVPHKLTLNQNNLNLMAAIMPHDTIWVNGLKSIISLFKIMLFLLLKFYFLVC